MAHHHRSFFMSVIAFITISVFYVGCSSKPEQPVPVQPVQAGQAVQQVQTAAQQPVQPTQPAQPAQPVQPAQPGQPVQPAQPGQNPLPGILETLGQVTGQMADQKSGQAQVGSVTHIPWQSLSKALPTNTAGWALQGQVKGESAAIMGISISKASCKLKQGDMNAEVEILDTTMNPLVAMPFNMARSVKIDSTEERLGPVNFGTYPGTQKFDKKRGRAEVMVMVHNRVMVTVKVKNAASEAQATGLAQHVNFAHLAKLVGG